MPFCRYASGVELYSVDGVSLQTTLVSAESLHASLARLEGKQMFRFMGKLKKQENPVPHSCLPHSSFLHQARVFTINTDPLLDRQGGKALEKTPSTPCSHIHCLTLSLSEWRS